MHWFSLPLHISETDLFEVIAKLKPRDGSNGIGLYAGKPGLFGPNGDVPVFILEKNPVLHAMHNDLLRSLTTMGCMLARNDWIGANYRPHVTVVSGYEFVTGAFHHATQLALIRRSGQIKEVIQLRRF